jgi:7,8-dihydropterin-6-yl-methyl-4-(beta-D-ribofuranosyl)aminobenzene 5'-phosphate synthase
MEGEAMLERVTLRPVEMAEVTVLVDNFVDMLLPDTGPAHRPRRREDALERPTLRAEHGYSVLLTVASADGTRSSILYDAGIGRDTAVYNLDVLEMHPAELRAVVLSHGHADHHGGLEGLIRRVGRPGMPLILHPDAWRERRIVFPTGEILRAPPPSAADLGKEGVEVVEERGPSLLLDGQVLVSGQTDRVTDFERGFPIQQARGQDGNWEPDPWVWDDQSVVVAVRDRGLVVLSACSHSGAVNVALNAKRATGVEEIHAFVGGLHLSGALFEGIIPATVAELCAMAPTWVAPGHCTGWRATHALAAALPDAFLPASVGTTFRFHAPEA